MPPKGQKAKKRSKEHPESEEETHSDVDNPNSPAPKVKKTTAAERRSMSSSLAARVVGGSGSQVDLVDVEYEAEKAAFAALLSSRKMKISWLCEDCPDTCKKKGRGALRGESGIPKHFVCKLCKFVCHGTSQQAYTNHIGACKGAPDEETNAPKETTNAPKEKGPPTTKEDLLALEEDIATLCCVKSKSIGKGLDIINSFVNLMRERGVEIPPVSLCARKYKKVHIPALTNKIWGRIKSAVEECQIFGVAVDAGVIRLHHHHVLASVLYVDGESFTLPLLYHVSHLPFSGKDAGVHLWNMLEEHLGSVNASKLSYVVIDGCGVNICMVRQLNEEIGRVTAEIHHIGEQDWFSLMSELTARSQRTIKKIPCLGHLIHNIAKDALLDKWDDHWLFTIRKLFRRTFYCSGKTSGKKGAYNGVLLDDALVGVPKEIEDAVKRFKTLLKTGNSIPTDSLKEILSKLVGLSKHAETLLPQLETSDIGRETSLHLESAEKIVEEATRALKVPSFKAPVLGGCTRWVTDMFDSVAYIRTHIKPITLYVSKQIHQKEPSKSMVELATEILKHPEEEIVAAADSFLTEGSFFRDVLQRFSNKSDNVCIADAHKAIESLKQECSLRKEWKQSFDHHWDRLAKKDCCDMRYFSLVQYLDPQVLSQTTERPPLGDFDKLFPKEKKKKRGDTEDVESPAIGFLDSELQRFLGTTDFFRFADDDTSQPAIERYTALKWWRQIGIKMFPGMAKTAIAFLTPPPVVNEVDSFFSVIDASFTDRQTRLGKDMVKNILFIARNMPDMSFEDDL